MAALGGLGIGLSIAFGGFVLVLLAELYYVFFWKKYSILNRRVNSVVTEYNTERCSFAHEAALVGSFGGYSGSAMDAEFVAKLFPMGPEAIGSDDLFMHRVFGDPRLLFTIKEETKEDMDFEEPGKPKDKDSCNNAAFARVPQQQLQSKSPSPKMSSDSPSPKQQQQQRQSQLMQFSYSIGLIQQPRFSRSTSPKSTSPRSASASLSPPPRHSLLTSSCDSSPTHDPLSSCSVPSSPVNRSSSSPPSRPSSSASVSPSPCPRLNSPKHLTFSGSGSGSASPAESFCDPNPIYQHISKEAYCSLQAHNMSALSPQETPFGTPLASPSLLTPCGTPPFTPPLTPIKAPMDASALLVSLARERSGTSSTSSSRRSVESNASFSSTSPSSESFHRNPSFASRRPPPLRNLYNNSPQKKLNKSPTMVHSHVNTEPQSHRKPTLMERRAFVSLFNEPALQSLPRESPRMNEFPPIPRFCRAKQGSHNSSNTGSPSTPFGTAPSTPYRTSPAQSTSHDLHTKEAESTRKEYPKMSI